MQTPRDTATTSGIDLQDATAARTTAATTATGIAGYAATAVEAGNAATRATITTSIGNRPGAWRVGQLEEQGQGQGAAAETGKAGAATQIDPF